MCDIVVVILPCHKVSMSHDEIGLLHQGTRLVNQKESELLQLGFPLSLPVVEILQVQAIGPDFNDMQY